MPRFPSWFQTWPCWLASAHSGWSPGMRSSIGGSAARARPARLGSIKRDAMTTNLRSLARPTFGSHLRALYAIAQKDWQQFWRYPLNVVGYIMNPLIWLAPVYFMGMAFSTNGKA